MNCHPQRRASARQPWFLLLNQANRGSANVGEFHQAIIQMEFHVLILSAPAPERIRGASKSVNEGGSQLFRTRPRLANMIETLKQTKRFLRILFGFTLLAIGAVMILTPGPGWLTIMLGLGVLAAEYVWARRLLDKLKEQGLRLRDVFLPRTGPA
jgi:Putative transmembrane protein (PGPGW)